MSINKKTDDVTQVFEADEMNLIQPHPNWTPDELLAKEGIFFLKDVAAQLRLDSTKIKNSALALQQEGQSPWTVMGVKKVWNNWVIRMKVFAPYYEANFKPPYQPLPSHWDMAELLRHKGCYLMSEAIKILPFNDHQLRYLVRKYPDSRKRVGVWKDPDRNIYLIEIPTFGKWMASQSPKSDS